MYATTSQHKGLNASNWAGDDGYSEIHILFRRPRAQVIPQSDLQRANLIPHNLLREQSIE